MDKMDAIRNLITKKSTRILLRCDYCGRFISLSDFPDKAVNQMVLPDSDYSVETFETYHKDCKRKDDERYRKLWAKLNLKL